MPQYGDAAFAAVIDKGTLDAIMCGEAAEQDAATMVFECHRCFPHDLLCAAVLAGHFAAPWASGCIQSCQAF